MVYPFYTSDGDRISIAGNIEPKINYESTEDLFVILVVSLAPLNIFPRFPKVLKNIVRHFWVVVALLSHSKANPDTPVWVNDLYEPLYNSGELRDNSVELSRRPGT